MHQINFPIFDTSLYFLFFSCHESSMHIDFKLIVNMLYGTVAYRIRIQSSSCSNELYLT